MPYTKSPVGFELEILDGLQDLLAGVLQDIRVVVQDPGNGRNGNPCLLGHIVNGDVQNKASLILGSAYFRCFPAFSCFHKFTQKSPNLKKGETGPKEG